MVSALGAMDSCLEQALTTAKAPMHINRTLRFIVHLTVITSGDRPAATNPGRTLRPSQDLFRENPSAGKLALTVA